MAINDNTNERMEDMMLIQLKDWPDKTMVMLYEEEKSNNISDDEKKNFETGD